MNKTIKPSRIALILGMKGGSGKSTFAILLAMLARRLGLSVAVFDADAAVSTTYLGLRDPSVPEELQNPMITASRFDLRDPEEAPEIVEAFGSPAELCIIDTPGGVALAMSEVLATEYADGFFEMGATAADLGKRLTVFHMVTADMSTEVSVHSTIERLGAAADYVAVINRHLVGSGANSNWTESEGRKALLAAGGREIELPTIPAALMPLWPSAFINSTPLDRIQLARLRAGYLTAFEAQVKLIADWIA